MFPFISPKTDFAFKKIFGSSQSKNILISFLNGLLYEGELTIQDLTILDPYQAPRIEGLKDSYLDVKAELIDGQKVIIEMQVLNILGLKQRVLYNAAKSFSNQLKIGEGYTLLDPVIALTITDFEMFEHSDRVVSRYGMKDKADSTDYSNDIELVFAELPKFTKGIDELTTLTDKWLYFLKEASRLESVPASLDQEPAIHDAFEIARESRLTREEMEAIDRQAIYIHDNRNSILLGRMEGKAEGKAEGRAEGRAEGQQEEKIRIVRNLLGQLSVEEISQITGLAIDEIEQLERDENDADPS